MPSPVCLLAGGIGPMLLSMSRNGSETRWMMDTGETLTESSPKHRGGAQEVDSLTRTMQVGVWVRDGPVGP